MDFKNLFIMTIVLALSYLMMQQNAAALEPYGLELVEQLERLPFLKPDTFAGQAASYDRSGENSDGFGRSNFLYITDDSEKVMAELKGPGCIYRMWFTGFNAFNNNIKIYLDGESTPHLDMLLEDVFDGTNAPFYNPLIVNDEDSSGGFVSYLPIPFKDSIKITTNSELGGEFFYQIGYHRFSPGTDIQSWTKMEDSGHFSEILKKVGKDPKSDSGNATESGNVNLAANESQTLFDIQGPRSISSIKLNIPQVINQRHGEATDNGRAHRGSSRFEVAIEPDSSQILLKRRLNYGIIDQKANVYIDGVLAGEWYDQGSDKIYQWRDSTFAVPTFLTSGKDSITVRLEFSGTAGNWTEYRYWVYSSGYITDEFNVGNAVSEAEHNYEINKKRLCLNGNFQYPPVQSDVQDILNNTWIRIYWDDETTASVNAPLGDFFGMGRFGNYPTHALPFGIDANNLLYSYFPMPFEKNAKIELYNDRLVSTADITYEIKYRDIAESFDNVGYFKTFLSIEAPSTVARDLTILNAVGSGNFVGVVQSVEGGTNRRFLEGDERIYVDDSKTPIIHGTGTEDFYSGGWYFNKGLFSRPMHGYVGHIATEESDQTAMYRLFLHDAVPFRKNINVSIEHGPTNNQQVTSHILAFYYHKPEETASLTDSFDLSNSESESNHDYIIENSQI